MLTNYDLQQGTFSEKDEQLRQLLTKLDTIDNESGVSSLSVEDVTALRRQLQDGQNLIRETVDRLRQTQEESEMSMRRRDEVEARLAALEAEYEELLGMENSISKRLDLIFVQRKPSTTRRPAMWISQSPWPNSRYISHDVQ